MNIEMIKDRVCEDYPGATDAFCTKTAEALAQLDPLLLPNLKEWLDCMPVFSDIWVRDRYCLRTVLKQRKSTDVISALLALDAYQKDPAQERGLFQVRY